VIGNIQYAGKFFAGFVPTGILTVTVQFYFNFLLAQNARLIFS